MGASSNNLSPAELLGTRENWRKVRFGDVVRCVNETVKDPLASKVERFVGLDHIEPGNLHIKSWGNVADGTTFTRTFKPGQTLFGKRRAYQRKVAYAEFEGVCSGDIYIFEPADDKLIPELLPFICQTDRFFEMAVGTSAGSLSPRTNWKHITDYEFLLPPLDDQRRIAEILWAADELAEAVRRAKGTAEEALAAKLGSLFGPGGNGGREIRFPLRPLRDVALLQTGIAKGKRYPASIQTVELPYLRVANVQDGRLDLSEMKTIVVPESDQRRYLLQDGDVVICEGGDFDKVGRGTLWRGQISPCLHQNHIFCLRADHSLLIPEFLDLQLGSPYGKKYFLGCAKKTSNLASINSTQVKAFPFQLPSLGEQRRIVEETGALKASHGALGDHLSATSALLRNLNEVWT